MSLRQGRRSVHVLSGETVPALSNQWVVEEVSLERVTPNPSPQRKHGERKIIRLMGAINAFGQLPILVSGDYVVLDGHAVLEACTRLGRPTLAVIRVSHLSLVEQRALMMARNRLVEDAEWNVDVLKADFQVILADTTIEFALEVTGFDQVYVDTALLPLAALAQDEIPPLPPSPVTQLDDLWSCGAHRILCGDSRELQTFDQLLGEDRIRLTLGDPPYDVPIAGNVSGLGKHKHGDFVMGSGEMGREKFVAFQKAIFGHCAAFSADGALAYFFIDGRHVRDQIEAGEAIFGPLKQMIVWAKDNAGLGSFYRSQFELLTIWKHGDAPHINNFGLGGSGRSRSNLWCYPGMSSLGKGRDAALSWHPTVKNLAMIADAILDVTRRRDIVCDPFGGSGTTLIAAERTGRRARLIEIDPKYVDVTLHRFIAEANEHPILVDTGETFEDVAARRLAEAPLAPIEPEDDWNIL